ncbi:hypothetical protein, partial [Corallococcus sp. CA041A]|uniref:hypothetical protein n=1 Tax=Corallococcus sp. CA041A TaxID=2316727 RepID=UPI001F4392EE
LYIKAAEVFNHQLSQESVEYFHKASSVDPDNPVWANGLAVCYWETALDQSEHFLKQALAAKRATAQSIAWTQSKLAQVPQQRRVIAQRTAAQLAASRRSAASGVPRQQTGNWEERLQQQSEYNRAVNSGSTPDDAARQSGYNPGL